MFLQNSAFCDMCLQIFYLQISSESVTLYMALVRSAYSMVISLGVNQSSLIKFTFLFPEFIQKLHTAYQAIQGGTYRPGQVVVVPSLSRPQHKQQTSQYAMQEGVTASSVDGVDVHIFLEAVSLIIHSSTSVFRYEYVSYL